MGSLGSKIDGCCNKRGEKLLPAEEKAKLVEERDAAEATAKVNADSIKEGSDAGAEEEEQATGQENATTGGSEDLQCILKLRVKLYRYRDN